MGGEKEYFGLGDQQKSVLRKKTKTKQNETHKNNQIAKGKCGHGPTLERSLSTTNQEPINQIHPRGNIVYEVSSGGGEGRRGRRVREKKKKRRKIQPDGYRP